MMAENENEKKNASTGASEPQIPELDAAGKSLTDALRVSFAILKIIMIILVVLFLTSGIFTVDPDENAMVLLFGRISGEGDQRILEPGLKWNLPAPITEVIRIPVVRKQTLQIDSFWYFMTAEEKATGARGMGGPTLVPGQDGYCLTRNDTVIGAEGADYNIVHSRWQLIYVIDNMELFFQNVYYGDLQPGQDFLDVAGKTVDPLLRSLAEDAIVSTLVKFTIDESVTTAAGIVENVQRELQKRLDTIESGIRVDSMRALEITWPRRLNEAFRESIAAGQGRQQQITQAKTEAQQILNEAGGPRAEEVLRQLKETEPLRQKLVAQIENDVAGQQERQQLRRIESEREALLATLSGASGQTIAEAQAYRTTVIKDAQARYEYLHRLLPEYQKRPQIVLQRIYQDAMEEILDKVDEKIVVQSTGDNPSTLWIRINRNPEITKDKQSMNPMETGAPK
ncbi:MAG: hypothetical protein JW828_08230 [Sedimentisphaerales bacterium]|nr:hypothetical protein [Sedimentisphaerales bacterium]